MSYDYFEQSLLEAISQTHIVILRPATWIQGASVGYTEDSAKETVVKDRSVCLLFVNILWDYEKWYNRTEEQYLIEDGRVYITDDFNCSWKIAAHFIRT